MTDLNDAGLHPSEAETGGWPAAPCSPPPAAASLLFAAHDHPPASTLPLWCDSASVAVGPTFIELAKRFDAR